MRSASGRESFLAAAAEDANTANSTMSCPPSSIRICTLESNFRNPNHIQALSAGLRWPVSFAGRVRRGQVFPVSLPQRNKSLACSVPTVFRQGLREGQFSGDGVECCVDAGGKRAHTGGAGKGDQSDEKSVLDQILTFVTLQVHDREVKLGDEVFHLGFSPRLISR